MVGLVPQIRFSLQERLRTMSNMGRIPTSEDIGHAIEIAQAEGFVLSTKEGFDSVIARGTMYQADKNRGSLLRGHWRKPKIYLFDDSFSALDFKTDANCAVL